MPEKIDVTKPVMDEKNGYKYKAEIVATDMTGAYPLLVVLERPNGERFPVFFNKFGDSGGRKHKLVNVPESQPLTPEEMRRMAGRVVVSIRTYACYCIQSSSEDGLVTCDSVHDSSTLLRHFAWPDGTPICAGSLDEPEHAKFK